MVEERHQREDSGEHGEPVEDAERAGRGERGEQRQLEPAVRRQRHAAQEIAERGAEEHRRESRSEREDGVPERTPQAVFDVRAELDRDAAQDERPENQEDRQVEAREAGREHRREGEEEDAAGGEQPDLVAVPERADRGQHLPAFPVGARNQEVEGAGAEIETVHDDIDRDHDRGESEPEGLHGRQFPRLGRSGSGRVPEVTQPARSVIHFPHYQREEEQAENEVETGEAQSGEERRAAVNRGRAALGSAHQAVDQPGLTAELGSQPSGGVGDIGKRKGERAGSTSWRASSRAGHAIAAAWQDPSRR